MKITSVIGADFLTLGEVDFFLDDKGLVLVQGCNSDDTAARSNGAGKSSLVDLVCWTLWGTTARGSSGDAVIRDGAKEAKGAVDLYDEAADENWSITRTRRKGKESLKVEHVKKGTGVTDHTQGTIKLTQALIERIVGSSEEVFRASVYMGQESLVDLPRMADRALKTIVEEAAGVTVLERAYEAARKRTQAEVTKVCAIKNEALRVAGVIAVKEALLKREDALVADWEAKGVGLVMRLRDEVASGDGTLLALKPDPVHAAALESQIARLDARLAGFTEERRRESELAAALSKAEAAVAAETATLKRMVQGVLEGKKTLAAIDGHIGTPCPECGTPMDASHVETARQAAARRLAVAGTETRAQQARHAGAAGVAGAARDALSAHRASMGDPSALASERSGLVGDLLRAQQAIHDAALLQERRRELCERIEARTHAENPHKAEASRLNVELGALRFGLSQLNDQLALQEQAVTQAERVCEVFGPAGVRAHILDSVTPYLNDRTAEYLGVLSDGVIAAHWTTLVRNARGELREKFSIEVTHSGGGRGFSELSGGEKRKVRLACAMALQDLVASRAGKPFMLFVADEIDHALDGAGLERLATVLQAKAAVVGTVVVISHNALDSYIPNVWTVTKEGGKSRLEAA